MLDHPTLHHLKGLRLDGMAEAFAELQMQDAASRRPRSRDDLLDRLRGGRF